MKLKITVHAQYRIAERNIDLDHIKNAIDKPDSKKLDPSGQIKVKKNIDGKSIEVVYFTEGFKDRHNTYVIVTAYYTS